jgi:hypothetical protein
VGVGLRSVAVASSFVEWVPPAEAKILIDARLNAQRAGKLAPTGFDNAHKRFSSTHTPPKAVG